MESNNNFGVVLVTVATLESEKAIANTLLTEKLAACINIFPVTSLYMWEEKVNNDQEYQLLIKTNLDRFSKITTRIQEIHPYKIPEIIALPIVYGSELYLNWLGETMEKQQN